MSFQISVVAGAPAWDTLPVAKITNYPLEKEAFKPFAQVRACVNEEAFYLRVWAFEYTKRPESYIGASFAMMDDAKRLDLQVYGDGKVLVNGEPSTLVSATMFEGEDLEGVYWGALLRMELSALEKIFPDFPRHPGEKLRGNFYKGCTSEEFAHSGSYAKTPRGISDLQDEKYFETFSLAAY